MQRPTSVTVFGILNIVFAVFGAFGLVVTLAMFSLQTDLNNPVIRLIHENPTYAAWMKFSVLLSMPGLLVLLTAGIGLLRMKSWARILSIIYAIYAIIAGIAGMVANFFFMVRPLLEQAQQQQGPEAAAAIGGAIGGGIGGCLGLIYPVLLLIFMTRPKVMAAFRPPTLPQA